MVNEMSNENCILIVDDEEDIGEILGDFLEDDFTCSTYSDPLEAIAAISENTYRCVITDLHMPKAGGMEIIEAVKTHQDGTPVILLTGNSKDDPLVLQAIEKGAVGVITKPFGSPENVIQSVQNFVKTS